MRPPKARTWSRRGHTPTVRVPGGRGAGRVSVAGLVCYRTGYRSRLLYRLRIYRRRKGEQASFTWQDYRDFLVLAHAQLGAPLILIWDNLNRHPCTEMQQFIDATDWLTVFQLPSYAPDLNPAEGIWSLLNRGVLANLAAANLDHLTRVIKRGLKKIQYRPHLIDGCLTETGLALSPP
ncbi:transposase [Streptomyces sp. VNUA24]|uniref:transposase n=1 Tax=Streptomyces sp. VNUA24 TaxID=3031131 RepID=UPI0023B826A0|nr:transposase [Streptomyces sp. VNUA24]WEH20397.1 transposase [Streptomyces sp. VNUA24]